MKVVVTVEHRFFRTPDGIIWTNGPNGYDFWTRYLGEFEGVKVAARVAEVPAVEANYRPATGPRVEFVGLPNYLGPSEYLLRAVAVQRTLRRACMPDDAVILRVSSHLGGCLEPELARTGRPFGLEVVSDPHDVFAPGAVRHPFRPFFRWWFTRQLRRQCHNASTVAYVTETALQARYPCRGYSIGMSDVEISPDTILASPTVFTTHYSSVELASGDSVQTHRKVRPQTCRNRLVSVGSLAQMYKAPDILIRAVAEVWRSGTDLTLDLVGDGKHRLELEKLAADLGVGDRVHFLGQLAAGSAVRERLDRSDLFVLASRCEGLPRAMIEAMARSLPCLGSTVGGIPELLTPEDLVPVGDVSALAGKIREVLSSPERMTRMSARNLTRAQEYRDDVLAKRRNAFLRHVRTCTEDWLEAAAPRVRTAETVEGVR